SGETFRGNLQVDVQVSEAGPTPSTNPDRHYTTIYHENLVCTSTEIHGFDPVEHLARCRPLIAQGYRAASMSVAEMGNGQLVSASVWHRAVVPEDAKEKLAKRQANAAAVLLKMGKPEKVWPLLKHSPDPRTRTYLIHRFGPLAVDAKAIVMRLEEEPDVTIRRALVLGLGEFGDEGWSP